MANDLLSQLLGGRVGVASKTVITVVDEAGAAIAARGCAQIEDEDGRLDFFELERLGKGLLSGSELGDDPVALTIIPQTPGYWVTHLEQSGRSGRVICPSLTTSQNQSWWHALLGPHGSDPQRGTGIRIGVIDTSFALVPSLSHIQLLNTSGTSKKHIAAGSFWRHGEAVCRILSDRDAPAACAPIAPGSDLLFASASFDMATLNHPRFVPPTQTPDEDLDPVRVQNAIFSMAVQHEVDIINLSMGTFERSPFEDGLEETIRIARETGVAVICAAGNRYIDNAAHPASMSECIGVAAYGRRDWGPTSALARRLEAVAEEDGSVQGDDIYFSPESAYGHGVDAVAPGVGILIARSGRAAFDVTGTSFAAPIATGLLAVALANDKTYLSLPRDEGRAVYAEQRFRSLCVPTGIDEDWEGSGAPVLR